MMKLTDFSHLHHTMRQWRHDLHQYPEIAYEEHRTSRKVADLLQSWGLEVHTGLGATGVVGILRGTQNSSTQQGRHIALRADMDALPLTECNTFAHASKQLGKMHGCGHDGHTTMLLGAAYTLAQQPDFLGTLYFIFQPAEEGGAGARRMIEDGLFERFPIAEIYGMHNWPGLAAGQFAIHSGAVMASTDSFDITITGKGGHAAMPDTLNDPIVVAAHVITALQSIVARNLRPVDSGVVSVTQLQAGSGAYNVIPEQVQLRGTIRTLHEAQRGLIKARMQTLVSQLSAAFNSQAELNFTPGYPPTINHAQAAEHGRAVATALVGEANVLWNPEPSMGAEDFAYFLQAKPGAYIWIGNGELSESRPLHNPYYDFNDDILPLGVRYWVTLAQQRLSL